jgi:hypothetical protein
MELSAVIDLISAVAVLLGIIFGLIQLRQYNLSRKREASLYLLNSFQTGEFLEGIWLIQELPIGLSKKEIEKRLGDEIRLIYFVMSAWETIGLLVYNREISLDMVDSAFSGPIFFSWNKLEKYVLDLRDHLNRDTPFEWFQWLAERMVDREKSEPPIPAHIAYRDWE